jgi:hypothetical protein
MKTHPPLTRKALLPGHGKDEQGDAGVFPPRKKNQGRRQLSKRGRPCPVFEV